EGRLFLGRDTDHLLADKGRRPRRDHAGQSRELAPGRRDVGEQAIDGHEGRKRRKQRQHGGEGYRAGHGGYLVFAELAQRPPQDVLPALVGYLGRVLGLAAAFWLEGCLVGALRSRWISQSGGAVMPIA